MNLKMYEFFIEEKLKRKLKKLYKKDKILYNATIKKIKEILNCKNLNHYKNLKNPLQKFKRVHIKKSFVLLFKIKHNKIIFYALKHHDSIYY